MRKFLNPYLAEAEVDLVAPGNPVLADLGVLDPVSAVVQTSVVQTLPVISPVAAGLLGSHLVETAQRPAESRLVQFLP